MSEFTPNLIRFARLLRELGIPVRTQQIVDGLRALWLVGVHRPGDVYHALRAVMVARREEMAIFDGAFQHVWQGGAGPDRARQQALPRLPTPAAVLLGGLLAGEGDRTGAPNYLERQHAYSPLEVLRQLDFEAFSPEQLEALRRLALRWPSSFELRASRRLRGGRRGQRLDLRRSLQMGLRSGGEVLCLYRRRPKKKARPLVALLDVSGSMEPYSTSLLWFLHQLSRRHGRVEAFLFATGLTRVTAELGLHSPQAALRLTARAARDWAGGTRIGEVLRQFNRTWGRRVLGRGAVAVILSDGWDRGQPDLLGREMARLAGRAHRVIWLNPLVGSPGYQPLTAGMRAALPHIDAFLPAHNLASLERLAHRIAALR